MTKLVLQKEGKKAQTSLVHISAHCTVEQELKKMFEKIIVSRLVEHLGEERVLDYLSVSRILQGTIYGERYTVYAITCGVYASMRGRVVLAMSLNIVRERIREAMKYHRLSPYLK